MMIPNVKYLDKNNENFRNILANFNLMDPYCKKFKNQKKMSKRYPHREKRIITYVGTLRIHKYIYTYIHTYIHTYTHTYICRQ